MSEMEEKCSLESKTNIRFQAFSSCLDPTFWYKMAQLKLEVDKLDEIYRPILGFYSSKSSPYVSLDCSSFNLDINNTSTNFIARGYCLNKNTLDSFKNCDKNELLKDFGNRLLDDFLSGNAIEDPTLIPTFNILTHSDLKCYHFYYWFAFPTFIEPMYYLDNNPVSLNSIFSLNQIVSLVKEFQDLPINQRGFFSIIRKADDSINLFTLKQYINLHNNNKIDDLRDGNGAVDEFLVFADPSELENNPGWPLRNFLYLILIHCPNIANSNIKVIAMRGTVNSQFNKSMIFNIRVQSNFNAIINDNCKFVGWEKNSSGKFCPKYVNLSKTMDPKKHAKESVNLNLKLMKWRLAPDLNLDIVAKSKCLIIGAGTLGCNVARNLLSWGVHNVTLIDNGKVSYSNPVRQSLYKHSHCISSTYKALAAAEVLKEIHPEINSNGVVMNIPMPGHGNASEDLLNINKLSKLIEEHDVIFLLTDSRESRWLPTMLSTLHNKLAVTAALGFDSYLVIRHGTRTKSFSSETKLGCYFCNDVTAPGNSMTDKTLDQQCTVTRPGVSSIAGALAVELFVSYAQLNDDISANSLSCIGVVPHSIRGFLSDYQQIIPFTPSFDKCIACSSTVINDFINRKEDFLKNVFVNSNYLEDLTGLTELKNQFEKIEIFEFDNNDDVCDSGNCTEPINIV
ncbi:ubiquitin-like modifier-activating enzyme ATG7 [Daktulosphaira vitifoliae]|uniref:ubiquitin-like modifier-activating enzyme ATG7 n=1 Tax=Daktulosphaira vitifoliae TaxID=58002 RepID=UPI0021AA4068|nr:ubiquitin-like modifier-activating enzyme ATG7 [Daktulosphaira vitifoliae]XP_050539865.1 ubiquitin-like modifier-activating enzyme ATG7 [Daktulosphaira vitifoliae]